MSRVLVLDHKDSFVFILAEQFGVRGAAVEVYRSDELEPEGFAALVDEFDPDLVVLSPGPGAPESAGVAASWLRGRPQRPVLGVCLGHQAMVYALGGSVGRARNPVHGRGSRLALSDDPLFAGAESLVVARYHSLVATETPEELRVIATLDGANETDAGAVMAVRHVELPWVGLQFHPESVLTPEGPRIIERIFNGALEYRASKRPTLTLSPSLES